MFLPLSLAAGGGVSAQAAPKTAIAMWGEEGGGSRGNAVHPKH